jgi:hypothetical protein
VALPPNAPRGRRASFATLQRPFYPAIPLQHYSYRLAYFYSVTLAWFCSALDIGTFFSVCVYSLYQALPCEVT